jgi:hypothetical protein
MTQAKTLNDHDELLFRQVNPNWIREGRVSSQAFRPMPKDGGLLSVDRASMTTAEASHRLFTEELRLASAGVWAITVAECAAQDLPVLEDPIAVSPQTTANPAHAVVSFASVSSKGQIEAKGQKLARCANERGRLYPDNDGRE